MDDERSFDELLPSPNESEPVAGGAAAPAPEGAPLSRRALREQEKHAAQSPSRRRRRQVPADSRTDSEPRAGARRPRTSTIVFIVVLVVVLGGGAAGVVGAWNSFGSRIAARFMPASNDYEGSGNGKEVRFTIVSGDIGSTIAANLAKDGITKTAEAPYKILLADRSISLKPGTYSLYQHMSAASAIQRLQDPKARLLTKIVVPEGTTLKGVISLLASSTTIPQAQIEQAAADYTSYGLPAGATSLEGYLFPATYSVDPTKSAHTYFQLMVDTMKQHLAADGVQPADYQHIVTFASLVQKEAGLAADFPKVARVFQNRLDQGMLLQSDATVAYGAGVTGRVTTTDAERQDAGNKYNTYVHPGLPVGPISNPGDLAITSALKPEPGTWLYFVTVNLETGETVFSSTFADHQAAVSQFQSWIRAHPDYNK